MNAIIRDWRAILVLVVTALLVGCTSTKVVSEDPNYLGKMRIGTVCRLKSPVYFYDINAHRFFFDKYPVAPTYWAMPEGSLTWDKLHPLPPVAKYPTTEEFKGIDAILDSGTRFSLQKIIYYNYFEGETSYYVFTIIDGHLKGSAICLNELMLETAEFSNYRAPNPKYLEVVE